jgi:hypothetical protein
MAKFLTPEEVRFLNYWGRSSNAVTNVLRIEAGDIVDDPRKYAASKSNIEIEHRYWKNPGFITHADHERLRVIVRKLAQRVPR